MKRMTPLARELGDALLARHKELCASRSVTPETVTEAIRSECTIPYGTLCELVGAPFMTETVGLYLNEVARWCESHGVPPINSLAVNGQTGWPGTGYFLAPGCGDWEKEVRECIACKTYPDKLPANA